jgi:hypothetical protein
MSDEVNSASGFIRFASVNVEVLMGASDTQYVPSSLPHLKAQRYRKGCCWIAPEGQAAGRLAQCGDRDERGGKPVTPCCRSHEQYQRPMK